MENFPKIWDILLSGILPKVRATEIRKWPIQEIESNLTSSTFGEKTKVKNHRKKKMGQKVLEVKVPLLAKRGKY
jgi:hypothetical protein